MPDLRSTSQRQSFLAHRKNALHRERVRPLKIKAHQLRERGLSIKAIGEALGVCRATVYNYLKEGQALLEAARGRLALLKKRCLNRQYCSGGGDRRQYPRLGKRPVLMGCSPDWRPERDPGWYSYRLKVAHLRTLEAKLHLLFPDPPQGAGRGVVKNFSKNSPRPAPLLAD